MRRIIILGIIFCIFAGGALFWITQGRNPLSPVEVTWTTLPKVPLPVPKGQTSDFKEWNDLKFIPGNTLVGNSKLGTWVLYLREDRTFEVRAGFYKETGEWWQGKGPEFCYRFKNLFFGEPECYFPKVTEDQRITVPPRLKKFDFTTAELVVGNQMGSF